MLGRVVVQVLCAFFIVAFGQPSFAPWLIPITAAFGYALFWQSIRSFPFRYQRFFLGTFWYFFVSLIQLSWMTAIEYQGMYILFVFVALSLWLGLQFGFLTLFVPYNRLLTIPRILAMASLWTLLEWSRFQVLCGFSWNPVGLSLSNIYALQWASLFGILGLSFWVIFVNLLALRSLIHRVFSNWFLWVFAAILPYLFGFLHMTYHEKQMKKEYASEKYSCVLVQTGLLPDEKTPLNGRIQAFISPYDQWRRILDFLKEQKEKNPNLILFPEGVVPLSSAYPYYDFSRVKDIFYEIFGSFDEKFFPRLVMPFGKNEYLKVTNLFWAKTISNIFDSEVIAGLDYQDSTGLAYNSAFYLLPNTEKVDRYDKRILMPLAEYLPFKWLSPFMENYGISQFFTHGKKANVFQGKLPISVSICYEETFPDQVRLGRLEGAEIFVNVTSDSWYPYSRLPSQHFEHAKFRAVENGVPLLRSCNTGITVAIDSLGRVVEKLKQNHDEIKCGSVFVKLDPYHYKTLFTLWGNTGILTICGGFLGVFFFFKKMFFW